MISPVDRYDASFLLADPYFLRQLQDIDKRLPDTAPGELPSLFRDVSLDLFALLAARRPEQLPNLCGWLPLLPSEAVQLGTVGASGQQAFVEAAVFVRAIVAAYERTGADLGRARILDYGICWARLSRLLYKYTPTNRLYGVDAWPSSLQYARDVGFLGKLSLIDPIPDRLPFGGNFDLIFAFSIFTHLSERATTKAVTAIRSALRPGGVFALTIRPHDYYKLLPEGGEQHRLMVDERGFAFSPEPAALLQGNYDYGNTTITIDYLTREWSGFRLLGVEIAAIDPYQISVMLQKVE